jgi:hypothetical protein
MSEYGGTIEELKAKYATARRAVVTELRDAERQKSEIEVRLNTITDDLILQGFKNPTALDILAVYLRHHGEPAEREYESGLDFEKGTRR